MSLELLVSLDIFRNCHNMIIIMMMTCDQDHVKVHCLKSIYNRMVAICTISSVSNTDYVTDFEENVE